jgi:hypothetical protein
MTIGPVEQDELGTIKHRHVFMIGGRTQGGVFGLSHLCGPYRFAGCGIQGVDGSGRGDGTQEIVMQKPVGDTVARLVEVDLGEPGALQA